MPELACDTSVLLYLHRIGSLDLLRRLSAESVLTPIAVREELDAGRRAGHDVPDLAALKWIQVVPVPGSGEIPGAEDLGSGERDVIRLVRDRPGRVALLDDRAARRIAFRAGIPFTGTLGLLLDAKSRGFVELVSERMDRLISAGFRIDRRLRNEVLAQAGESPRAQ